MKKYVSYDILCFSPHVSLHLYCSSSLHSPTRTCYLLQELLYSYSLQLDLKVTYSYVLPYLRALFSCCFLKDDLTTCRIWYFHFIFLSHFSLDSMFLDDKLACRGAGVSWWLIHSFCLVDFSVCFAYLDQKFNFSSVIFLWIYSILDYWISVLWLSPLLGIFHLLFVWKSFYPHSFSLYESDTNARFFPLSPHHWESGLITQITFSLVLINSINIVIHCFFSYWK